MTYNFVVHSNKMACRKMGRLGMDPVQISFTALSNNKRMLSVTMQKIIFSLFLTIIQTLSWPGKINCFSPFLIDQEKMNNIDKTMKLSASKIWNKSNCKVWNWNKQNLLTLLVLECARQKYLISTNSCFDKWF